MGGVCACRDVSRCACKGWQGGAKRKLGRKTARPSADGRGFTRIAQVGNLRHGGGGRGRPVSRAAVECRPYEGLQRPLSGGRFCTGGAGRGGQWHRRIACGFAQGAIPVGLERVSCPAVVRVALRLAPAPRPAKRETMPMAHPPTRAGCQGGGGRGARRQRIGMVRKRREWARGRGCGGGSMEGPFGFVPGGGSSYRIGGRTHAPALRTGSGTSALCYAALSHRRDACATVGSAWRGVGRRGGGGGLALTILR